MDAQTRRHELISMLMKSSTPITGATLAKQFGVSRQVIVTDIAILRAEGYEILATPQGYVLNRDVPSTITKTIAVRHGNTLKEIEDELNLIVDHGAKIRDVIIEHPVYGEIRGLLMLRSRRDVQEFIESMKRHAAEPLLVLTDGIHLHTLEADNASILEEVETALHRAGYTLSDGH